MTEQLVPAQLIDVVWTDWRRRWQRGERVLVESYFQRYPALGTGAASALELVYQEVLLREERGEKPEKAEYLRRFPQLASELERLFEVHSYLQTEPPPNPGIAAPAPGGDEAGRMPSPVVPGYEILGRLGRGGMGVVYRARDERLNRVVALKMILAEPYAEGPEIARFRAEAEGQARLQHPNIVQIYEVGEAGGRPYFALEYVGGGSLDKRLTGLPQPPHQAARMVETLARAMHHAHLQGLVHRDLKPANVLLTADGTPKITDFGLAKRLQNEAGQPQSGAVVGTPRYMAPEQTGGQTPTVGPAADVYALGVILYEMLTGRPPFLGETALDTLLQVRSLDPVPPRRLQPKV